MSPQRGTKEGSVEVGQPRGRPPLGSPALDGNSHSGDASCGNNSSTAMLLGDNSSGDVSWEDREPAILNTNSVVDSSADTSLLKPKV